MSNGFPPEPQRPSSFLEWLTLGKLSVLSGTFAFVVVMVVTTLYGTPQ